MSTWDDRPNDYAHALSIIEGMQMAFDLATERSATMLRAQAQQIDRLTLALRDIYETAKANTGQADLVSNMLFIRRTAAEALRITIGDRGGAT